MADARLARAAGVLVWTLAALIPVAFLAIFFAWPAGNLVLRGFIVEGRPSLAGIGDVLGTPRTWRVVAQTLSQACLGTVACVLLGVPGAFLLYKTRFPGRGLVRALVTIPFVMPTVVVGVAFKALFADHGPLGMLHLEGSLVSVVAALVFFNYSVIVRTVGGLWSRLDPRLADAAATLGAPPARVFLTVTLPALAPAIASGAALVFLFCAGAYGIVMVLGGPSMGTLETEIWYQTTQLLDLQAASALAVLQLAIVSASLIVTNALGARAAASALRSDSSAEREWEPRDLPVTALTACVIGGVLVAPLGGLIVDSLRTPAGWGLAHYRALSSTAGTNLSVTVWQAALNSLIAAFQAAAIAVTLGVLVSVVVSRRPRSRVARGVLAVLDAVFMLPLGVSAVTVGFGFLITLNRPPLDLRSSTVLIPIAQAMVALPLVVRSLLPVLRAIDPRQLDAAATLGASPGRAWATIELPYVVRALGLAIGFALATSIGEFGATSFLVRPDSPTLPVVIYRLISHPGEQNYGMATAASVILASVTGVIMALAERLRPQEATGL